MSDHILVVDDDPEICTLVSMTLADEGYQVETAANGAEALQAIEQVRPRCVLLDMRMPVLNGWDFARELQARDLILPIIVMTAADDARRWANEIGAVDCLAKPFDLSDLLMAVERLHVAA
jgi:CheY-like chemotaxis protein